MKINEEVRFHLLRPWFLEETFKRSLMNFLFTCKKITALTFRFGSKRTNMFARYQIKLKHKYTCEKALMCLWFYCEDRVYFHIFICGSRYDLFNIFNSCHFHHRVPSSILRSHNNLFSRTASFSWGCCNCAIRDRELCTEFYYIEFISQITEAENEKGDQHLLIAKNAPLRKTTI